MALLSDATMTSCEPSGSRAHAERQRSDAVRIPERDDAAAVDHGHRRIAAPAPLVDAAQRLEHMLGVRLQGADRVQLVREHVQQDLGVRIRG